MLEMDQVSSTTHWHITLSWHVTLSWDPVTSGVAAATLVLHCNRRFDSWRRSTAAAAAEGQRAQPGADRCHPRVCGAPLTILGTRSSAVDIGLRILKLGTALRVLVSSSNSGAGCLTWPSGLALQLRCSTLPLCTGGRRGGVPAVPVAAAGARGRKVRGAALQVGTAVCAWQPRIWMVCEA